MKYPKIISASAGSGKTYTLTEQIFNKIDSGQVSPNKIIATTFTKKAASELKGRIREKLIEKGKTREADLMNDALIGTINSVCLGLLQRYAFEAGLSPMLETLDEDDQKVIIRELLGEKIKDEYLELAFKFFQTESNGGYNSENYYITQIEAIISKTKANDIDPEKLEEFGQKSADEFLALYKGEVIIHDDLVLRMSSYVDEAIADLGSQELNKTNQGHFLKLKQKWDNVKNGTFIWDEWRSISTTKLKSPYLSAETKKIIIEATESPFLNERFHEDCRNYISQSYQYAYKVLNTYDIYKKERGLLDFADQESEVYQLLKNNKTVSQLIAKEYDLIVVDEFQDVSPIQLSLFLKLAQLIPDSIWVGDPKQSIYAFRGADPKLMKSVVNIVPDAYRDQLDKSYRSRKGLIDFSNRVFSDAFNTQLTEKEIVLEQGPASATFRIEEEEKSMAAAVNFWKFTAEKRTNKEVNIRHLAKRIESFLADPPIVFDKNKKAYRPATYSDIAILCRSNKTCQSISNNLTQVGVSVASSGFGLVEEPEIIFISALLKLLTYPNDALAKAEVLLYMKYNGDQSAMLASRMSVDKVGEWDVNHPILVQVTAIRKSGFNLSAVRAIEELVDKLELEQLFTAWGNINQRMANVDALLLHAQDYQVTCNRLKVASSIPGFLNWMAQLSATEDDDKGVQYGNAVQVMTYHGSKGLEWPVVILWDLDNALKSDLFGVKMVSEKDVDINDPLANRRMRYWVNPFVFNAKPVKFNELIHNSEEYKLAHLDSIEEEKRLFYVALTRARDYLIMCTIPVYKSQNNLSIPSLASPVFQKLHDDPQDKIEGEPVETLTWNGKTIPVHIDKIEMDKVVLSSSKSSSSIRNYFSPRSQRGEHLPLFKNPSKELELENAITGKIESIHTRQYINKAGIENSDLGNLIHNLICAYDKDNDNYQDIIRDKLSEYNYDTEIDAAWLYNSISAFYDFLKDSYLPYKIHREIPIQAITEEGNYVRGYVDMVIELEGALMVIDHKTFVTKEYAESAYRKKAKEYSGQLKLYKDLLSQSFCKPVVGTFIYYVFEGIMVEVEG